ncbi:MAG: hypothetical protein E7403_00110 [Ruminococcaceae bacterium]|nr:hypothetical protein [Oscillospiraceae bacterium]
MIKFIDANCMIGNRMAPREGSPVTTGDFLEIMDRVGIEQAICYHSVGVENSCLLGIPELEKTVTGYEDRLMKQWVVQPNIWDEFMTPQMLLAEMKKHSVKTVRFFPFSKQYSMAPYSAGSMIDALSECNVPIFVNYAEMQGAANIYDLCKNYPKAKFVICDPGYRTVRFLAPIFESCDNIYLDSSNFIIHNAVARFCQYVGAERMLFGSGMPNASAAAATSLIRYADISDEEKQLIASGNILRLLEEVAL